MPEVGEIAPDFTLQHKFAEKFGLPYRLLGDADHSVAEAYEVWAEKSMYGKKYMGMHLGITHTYAA